MDGPPLLDVMAQDAYVAYGKATGGKNYQGLPMPPWEDLGATIQEAWRQAVRAVLIEVAPSWEG